MNSILSAKNSAYIDQRSDSSPSKHRRTGSSSSHTHEVSTPTEPSPLELLPDVPMDLILSKLGLPDLTQLGSTSRSWQQKVIDDVLIPTAIRLKCPLKETSTINDQLQIFVRELQTKISAISDRPSDIKVILREPTIAQIEHLQKWLEARDTLVFWRKLVGEIKRQIPGLHLEGPSMTQLKNSQDAIDKAKEFSGWFAQNQNVLAQLVKLDLRNNHLSWLPAQIDKLVHLEKLFLGTNQFTKLPDQICTLSCLRILDLKDNQLSSFPKEFGKLTKLRELDIRGNPLPMVKNKPAKLKIYQFFN